MMRGKHDLTFVFLQPVDFRFSSPGLLFQQHSTFVSATFNFRFSPFDFRFGNIRLVQTLFLPVGRSELRSGWGPVPHSMFSNARSVFRAKWNRIGNQFSQATALEFGPLRS